MQPFDTAFGGHNLNGGRGSPCPLLEQPLLSVFVLFTVRGSLFLPYWTRYYPGR